MTPLIAPHILIVDADILVRTPLAKYLRECGYLVMEAADRLEDQALLADRPSAIDSCLRTLEARSAADLPWRSGYASDFPALR